MENTYDWAVNRNKLSRAIGTLPLGATEDMVMEKYVLMGGLLAPGYGAPTSEATGTEPVLDFEQETVSSTDESIEKPKRRYAKKK